MISDAPFVSYKDEKPKSESKKAMDDLAERWAKRNAKKQGEKVKLSDFLRDDNVVKQALKKD